MTNCLNITSLKQYLSHAFKNEIGDLYPKSLLDSCRGFNMGTHLFDFTDYDYTNHENNLIFLLKLME